MVIIFNLCMKRSCFTWYWKPWKRHTCQTSSKSDPKHFESGSTTYVPFAAFLLSISSACSVFSHAISTYRVRVQLTIYTTVRWYLKILGNLKLVQFVRIFKYPEYCKSLIDLNCSSNHQLLIIWLKKMRMADRRETQQRSLCWLYLLKEKKS